MKKNKRIILMFIIAFIWVIFADCEKSNRSKPAEQLWVPPPFTSFRDIPGITETEIKAIEALQRECRSFVYGMPQSTEAFIVENNEIKGFSALFCGWLSELFGIPFKPAQYEWLDLLKGLERGDVDFTGEVRATEERRKKYFMTDAIAERVVKCYCLTNTSLSDIAKSRRLRYALIKGSAQTILPYLEPDTYEMTYLSSINQVHSMLKSGRLDAFFHSNTVEANFFKYADIAAYDFFPMLNSPVSLTTQDPLLEPIISVMQKALQRDSTQNYLTWLYEFGYNEYRKHRLLKQITEEESEYIKANPVVKYVAAYDRYPISFYDENKKQWQGISFDVLKEVEALTGLSFQIINSDKTVWPVLLNMLESGKSSMISELIHSEEREGRFLWPNSSVVTDYYALISKSDYHNIKVNEVIRTKVGLLRGTVYAEMFKTWFPFDANTVEYDTINDAIDALDNDEIDMIMASESQLLIQTNYRERSDFKSNIIFDSSFKSTFGFNKNEAVLCSIVDKALGQIDTNRISRQWMRKTYDYRAKMIQAQRLWLIGLIIVFSCVFVLIFILFQRNHRMGEQLKNLVAKRSNELEIKTSLLEVQTSTLMTLFDSMPDFIFCKDLNSRFTRCNKRLEDYFGVSEADIIGKSDVEAFKFPVKIADKLIIEDRKVINEKRPFIFEEYISTLDGNLMLVETIKAPLMQNGDVVGVVGIARDITRRKAMEMEAKIASEAKSRFIANMSHEMRTPMDVIVGLTDLMLEEKVPPDVMENLKKINIAGNTLLGLINDILDISKIEEGKLDLSPAEYEMASLLNDIITLNLIRISNKSIEFKLDISEELPYSLYGDDMRVKQILNNLLDNAFKFTQNGTITLGVSCVHDNAEDVWMSVYVSDTGIGIHKEDLEKIFSDYNQSDTDEKSKVDGHGFGLSTAKKFVDIMDGQISVKSEYGKGTTFRLRIRQGFVTDKTIGKETAENLCNFRYSDEKKYAYEKFVRADLSYAKVLVVDDLQSNLDVAVGLLSKYKMHIDCLTNGQDAVDRIRNGKPIYNAIFMDHMMPGMDGMETTMKIRSIGTEYAEMIPIIVLTANAIAGNEQMFLENGFQAFLSKPIDIIRLNSIVMKWVSHESQDDLALPDVLSVASIFLQDENTVNIHGVDTGRGLSLYKGELGTYLPLLRSYAVNTPAALDKLRIVSKETLQDYAVNIHGLKGSSANIGAEKTRATAFVLETMARKGDLDGVLAQNDRFIKDTENIVDNIKTWFEQYDSNQ